MMVFVFNRIDTSKKNKAMQVKSIFSFSHNVSKGLIFLDQKYIGLFKTGMTVPKLKADHVIIVE